MSAFFELGSILKCTVSAWIIHTHKPAVWLFFFSPIAVTSAELVGCLLVEQLVSCSPTPPPLSGAPNASAQWIHLHPHYRTNWHAGGKANQILWQQLGAEIAFLSVAERQVCLPSSLGVYRGGGGGGECCSSWTASLLQVNTQPFPLILNLFPNPSLLILTSPSVTQPHWGLHSSLPSSRWNRTIIMRIEWLWPSNWGCSDHNNTLSNLIKEPFVASTL